MDTSQPMDKGGKAFMLAEGLFHFTDESQHRLVIHYLRRKTGYFSSCWADWLSGQHVNNKHLPAIVNKRHAREGWIILISTIQHVCIINLQDNKTIKGWAANVANNFFNLEGEMGSGIVLVLVILGLSSYLHYLGIFSEGCGFLIKRTTIRPGCGGSFTRLGASNGGEVDSVSRSAGPNEHQSCMLHLC